MMHRFKSFFSSAVVAVSCTTSSQNLRDETHLYEARWNEVYGLASSPKEFAELCQLENIDQVRDSYGAEKAKYHVLDGGKVERDGQTKAYYCRGDRQTKAVKYQITAVVPSFKGFALNEAASFEAKYISSVREHVAEFYSEATSRRKDRPTVYLVDEDEPTMRSLARISSTSEIGYFVFVANIRSNRVYILPSDEFRRRSIQSGGSNKKLPKNAKADPIVAEPIHVAGLSTLRSVYAMMLTGEQAHEVVYGGKDRIRWQGDTRGPAKGALNSEEREQALANTIEANRRSKALLPMSDLVAAQDFFWANALKTMNNVKEAPGSTPDTIEFDVSLDLGLFCQTGRLKRDLMAH